MSYVEAKLDFLVESARRWCGTESIQGDLPQAIAGDILDALGRLLARRDADLLRRKGGDLLSVFPLLKRDAEGMFLEKLAAMEDVLLSIQVELRRVGA